MGTTGRIWRNTFVAAATAIIMTAGALAQVSWVTVSAADNTFHFLSPMAPTVETKDAMEGDTPYTITTYLASANGFAVIGAYTIYHANNVEADADQVLGGFLKGLNAELVSSTPMTYQRGPGDTLKGVLASAKNENMTCHLRVVVEDVRIYTLAACGAAGVDATADMDRVIGSLTITKP